MYHIEVTEITANGSAVKYFQAFEVLDIQIFARELNNSYWAKVVAPKEGE